VTPTANARAYEEIKRLLFTGGLEAGERIPVEDLCVQLGVSRTPVREALVTLENEGLVRTVPRKGYFAREVSFRAAIDAWQLRILIEPIATAFAARRAGPAEVTEIVELSLPLDEQATTADEIARNRAFHLRIAQASGSPRLAKLMTGLMDDIERLLYIELESQHTERTWEDEHATIAAAIAAHDTVAAAQAVRQTFVTDTGFLALQAKSELISVLGQRVLEPDGGDTGSRDANSGSED
jgi:GntR family transcriptional regulator, rspAB operon transcriptional repressor